MEDVSNKSCIIIEKSVVLAHKRAQYQIFREGTKARSLRNGRNDVLGHVSGRYYRKEHIKCFANIASSKRFKDP